MSSKICALAGTVILIHAAYSYKHYKGLITSLNITVSDSAPIDVIVELIVAFLLIVFGQLSSLRLRQIKVSANIKGKSFDEVMGRTDYTTFNTRSSVLANRLGSAKSH